MNLSVGIVGLPNVGKSTLFNALLKKEQALAANYPFATIDPNVGVVPVPDERLAQLADVITVSEGLGGRPPIVPSVCEFVDIAGLVKGASEGAGLGNKFLSHIREVDAICHVVRNFSDSDIIREGSTSPKADLEIIETELMMADFATLEKQREPKGNATREEVYRWEAVQKIREAISSGKAAREVLLTEEQALAAKSLSLLTSKPIMVVLNSSESDLKNAASIEESFSKEFGLNNSQVVVICASLESQLASLSDEEQLLYLSDLGLTESGLTRLIKKAFSTLGLMSFLTAGEKEVRAWTIKVGSSAVEASGAIHTDFMKHFIKADVVSFLDFVETGGWKKCREQGKVRSEGKEYVVNDGDVVEFKIGT